jgi:hypothetical protein
MAVSSNPAWDAKVRIQVHGGGSWPSAWPYLPISSIAVKDILKDVEFASVAKHAR